MDEIKNRLRTGKILKPNQPGTKKWVEKYGDDLICVRYRYDERNEKKLKTVEIIVEERNWKKRKDIIPFNKLLPLRINYEETWIWGLVKSAGGKWNSKKKVWSLAYGQIISLGLEKRILDAADPEIEKRKRQ
ncbi:MAG: hypothetical protein WCE54_14990 [Ignavibacteriaceae bacterium]